MWLSGWKGVREGSLEEAVVELIWDGSWQRCVRRTPGESNGDAQGALRWAAQEGTGAW